MEGRMNCKDYIRLLSRHLLLYMGSSYVFMDDNAPCHQSQAVIRWILSVSKLLAGTVYICDRLCEKVHVPKTTLLRKL